MRIFGPAYQENIHSSIYPSAARAEVMNGRLPHLNTDKLFLKQGEFCAYADKALLNVHLKKRMSKHTGVTMPGLVKGHRVHTGFTKPIEYEEMKQVRGILYITNKRVIFQASEHAFEKTHGRLSTVTPFSNAVVLQFGNQIYELIVYDGSVVNQVLKLVSAN